MSGDILQFSHTPSWCAQGQFFTGFRDQDYFSLTDTTEYISCLYSIMEVETALIKLWPSEMSSVCVR